MAEPRPAPGGAAATLDVAAVRRAFPALEREVAGHPLVYLDSAATTQRPAEVIARVVLHYERHNANIHRGVHTLSQEATADYENVREMSARFIGAGSPNEVIFVRGATEAINLVAQTHGAEKVGPGDEIVLTQMEHHSNIVPWQLLARRVGARLVVIPMSEAGEISLDDARERIGSRTKIVAVVHTSNALGTVNPVRELSELAHAQGATVVVDGAQAVPHAAVDVAELGCDFFAFSSHKMYGPTGAGVLWGRAELLEEMPPYQGGGEMIRSVTFDETLYNDVPFKFEAGTPNIAGVIGMGAAIEFLERIGLDRIAAHEADLLAHGTEVLEAVDGVEIVGRARHKAAVLSFVLDGIHPHDIGTILDRQGIAIRTGHHCAQPALERLGLAATARASLAVYNTKDELDRLAEGLEKVKEMFGR